MASMTRLLIALLCAFGLALAPTSAGAAGAPSSGMPGCAMGGKQMPNMPVKHSRMDCCTPACQAPSPSAALLPTMNPAPTVQPLNRATVSGSPTKELSSIAGSGLDPPPRT